MIPTIPTTTLVNDRREARIRQAQLHRLAGETAGTRPTIRTGPAPQRTLVVLRAWRIAFGR